MQGAILAAIDYVYYVNIGTGMWKSLSCQGLLKKHFRQSIGSTNAFVSATPYGIWLHIIILQGKRWPTTKNDNITELFVGDRFLFGLLRTKMLSLNNDQSQYSESNNIDNIIEYIIIIGYASYYRKGNAADMSIEQMEIEEHRQNMGSFAFHMHT